MAYARTKRKTGGTRGARTGYRKRTTRRGGARSGGARRQTVVVRVEHAQSLGTPLPRPRVGLTNLKPRGRRI